jgi:hypothetical protein
VSGLGGQSAGHPALPAKSVAECSHGRPDHIELIHQLREALGFQRTAIAASPKVVWEQTLEYVRKMAGTGKYDDRGVCS